MGIKLDPRHMSESELMMAMQDRLFRLIVQVPGVALFASDVELFGEAGIRAGKYSREEVEADVKQWKRSGR
jgi:hypothetical protein